ncbi:MAG: transcription elongation factor GreA [Dehalococcoidia bacterium]|jgi:transcription elongation factor GreA
MSQEKSLSEAAAGFLASLPTDQKGEFRQELNKFVTWGGKSRPMTELSALEVANYAESINSATTDVSKVTAAVKAFLVYAKKEGLTSTNLSVHLRVKKLTSTRTASTKGKPSTTIMTEAGRKELETELTVLKQERPKLSEDIRKAAADKDFRENAPLEAARERQGMVESRIRQLEQVLKTTVVSEERPSDRVVSIGTTVTIQGLSDSEEMSYKLVHPNEANPLKGKLSISSPIGKALLEHKQGDVIEVIAPAGTLNFRVVRIVS